MADEQRFVLGIAYQAGPDPRITKGADGGRDFFTKAELEKAAWSFMRNGPRMNAFHVEGTEDCAQPVESFIWRWEDWDAGDGIVVKDGDWLLGSILSPRMWNAHKAGKVSGYSPEGTARRRRVAKEGVVQIAKGSAELAGDEDELTELTGADMTKVALVGHGANGIPRFLISKEDGATGLLEPEFVRDLIAKAEPGPEPDDGGPVTMTGSPAAIAKLMQEGALRFAKPADDVAKAEMSSKSINDLPDGAFAYIAPGGKKDADGKTTPRSLRHFPVHDAAHTRNALSRAPQSEFGDKAMPKIRAAAKRFGIEVSKEAGVAEPVTKADDMGPELDGGVDGMDPTVALAEPDEMGPGDMTDPGSPAWESIDAATAQKWTSIAVRLKNALCVLAEREMLEAASADPDDCENAFDLQDAMCAVDYVIDTLAGFAVDEQAEADLGGEAMDAVGKSAPDPAALEAIAKAMDGADLTVTALAKLETFAVIAKTGRVLSSVNEAHIREAATRLNTVLASLPQAPTADDGQLVAKEKETTVDASETETAPDAPVAKADADEQAAHSDPVNAGGVTGMGTPKGGDVKALPGDVPGREVLKAALALVYDQDRRLVGVTDSAAIVTQVAKADGDGEKKPMQAVFDQDGDLIGIVDPDAIQPVTGAGGKAPADDGGAAPAADAADDSDMTPQPPADTGTPADAVADDNVTKGAALDQDPDKHAVLKSAVKEALAELLGERAPAEDVAKQADVAGLRERLEDMAGRLETVEKQDARPGVFANGAVPPPDAIPPSRPSLRGQDQGADRPIDVAKALDRKREFYTASATDQNRMAGEMQQDAIDALTALHAQRRPA